MNLPFLGGSQKVYLSYYDVLCYLSLYTLQGILQENMGEVKSH